MWYNDILLILLLFVGLLLIVMTIIISSRMGQKKPAPVIEEKPEKIFVEKGFEKHEPEPKKELEYETPFEKPSSVEQEPIEKVSETKSEYTKSEAEAGPDIAETLYDSLDTPKQHFEDVVIPPVEPIVLVSDEEEHDSTDGDVITSVESILIDSVSEESSIEKEPNLAESPTLEEEHEVDQFEEVESYNSFIEPPSFEPSEDVLITPSETFYESTPEDTTVDKPNPLEVPEDLLEVVEPEPEIDKINETKSEEDLIEIIEELPEIELPLIEPEVTEAIEDEVEPDTIDEGLVSEPKVSVVNEQLSYRRKLRKPVIDESDPELNLDLGVRTCPSCGAKVPNTIYCILCGKPLDPDNVIGYDEETEAED